MTTWLSIQRCLSRSYVSFLPMVAFAVRISIWLEGIGRLFSYITVIIYPHRFGISWGKTFRPFPIMVTLFLQSSYTWVYSIGGKHTLSSLLLLVLLAGSRPGSYCNEPGRNIPVRKRQVLEWNICYEIYIMWWAQAFLFVSDCYLSMTCMYLKIQYLTNIYMESQASGMHRPAPSE